MSAINGLTQDMFNEAIDTLYILPLSQQKSVSEENNGRVKLKVSANQTGEDKFPSHIIKALSSLNGTAGYRVSSAMTAVFNLKDKKEKLLDKQENDRADEVQEQIEEAYRNAQSWMALRNYYHDKLESQIQAENVQFGLYPVEPFEINEFEIKRDLKKAGAESLFAEKLEYETAKRANIIELIKGIKPDTDAGPVTKFDSIYGLMPKLEEMAKKEYQLRTKMAVKYTRFAEEHNVKGQAIDTVYDLIAGILNNAYDTAVDDISASR